MNALALQTANENAAARKEKVSAPRPVSAWFNQPISTSTGPLILRKAHCACGGDCPQCQQRTEHDQIQTKLEVSAPGDVYEQEADRVADQVMRMAETSGFADLSIARWALSPVVQRKYTSCEERQEDAVLEDESAVRAKEQSGQGAQINSEIAGQIGSLRGGGEPLAEAARAFFEPRFGRDLTRVRIHSDARAAESARAVNALAYTVGPDIVFGAGQYAPDTIPGQRLLAHELTHVLQNGAATTVRRQGGAGAGAPTAPTPTPGVCGPNVDSEVTRVWTRIQTDFRGWSNNRKRDSCLMLIEPIIIGPPLAPTTGHSPVGLGLIDLARSGYEGLQALSRIIRSVGSGAAPSPADLAALDAAAASASATAQSLAIDIGTRIDNLMQLSVAIARIARDAPALIPPLQRIIDTLLRGDIPSATDVAALLAAAGGMAPGIVQLIAGFERAAGVVQQMMRALVSGQGAVVAVDIMLQALGIKLNRDAFDTIGLFQNSMGYTRRGPYFPRCATPGSLGNPTSPRDPLHEDPTRCPNTVAVGGVCWLSGTPNYGTYGIMMRLCFDWTSLATAPTDMQRLNFAFSRRSTEFFARGYKALDADSPTFPGDWVLATYDSGPGARIGGGNRTHCSTTCAVPYGSPGHFDYVWETAKPRGSLGPFA